MRSRSPGIRPASGVFLSLIALAGLLSIVAAIALGSVPIPPETVAAILLDVVLQGSSPLPDAWHGQQVILLEIRLPRAILAATVGAGLSVVGAALQSVTRNPLADPHLLGISSGGAFGAILALLHTGLFLGAITVPLLAFLGAMVAVGVVTGVVRFAAAGSADRLVLAGVAVSFVIMALANVLIFFGDPRATHTVVYWMLGSLGLAQWDQLWWPAGILLPSALWIWRQSGALNAMSIGDETAVTLGLNATLVRVKVFIACALITGAMVAFSGMIGFVGLMIPHIARMIVGGDNRRIIPCAALLGSVFLVWTDIGARTLFAPEDIPIGIMTGLIGGLFFIWLLSRTRRL